MNGRIIGRKLGMTQIFDTAGLAISVTVIEAGPCHVTQVRSAERDGYSAVQLGFNLTKPERLARGERGHLGRLPSYRMLREFRVDDISAISVGDEVRVDGFAEGDIVDVIGTSKGKGFQGVMKRHGFRGGPRTHGQSDRARAPGAIGAGTTPSRVIKGLRMAGRMGAERVTVKGLRVVRVITERNLLLVRGSVPGNKNGMVIVRRASEAK